MSKAATPSGGTLQRKHTKLIEEEEEENELIEDEDTKGTYKDKMMYKKQRSILDDFANGFVPEEI